MSTDTWSEPIYKLSRSTIDELTEHIIKINALIEIATCHNFHLHSQETTEFFFSSLLDYSQRVLEIANTLMQERCVCPNLKN